MPTKIIINDYAQQDIVNIYKYLSYEILMPETAQSQVERIHECIKNLVYLPERNKVYQANKNGKKVRRAIIDNYGIYYIYDEQVNEVFVVAIIYTKCSESTIIKKLNREN